MAFLKILRKNKKFYYNSKHFTAVSGMIYRMKQNAVGLANICILSTMVPVSYTHLCAGRISKISWFKSNIDKWSDKILIAFCTGGSPFESPQITPFLLGNFSEAEREKVHVFYCPGGFNYEKMSAGSKLMMKRFQKMVGAKKDKTEDDIKMLKMISHSYDISDKKYIEPIIKLISKEK